MPLDPTVDTHFIVIHNMNTWTAFMKISEALQLDCSQIGFNIRNLSPPPPLSPTIQQQIIPHAPYIDMLPWSSLRDRVLNSIKVINEQELVFDMTDFKVWGSTPWDLIGWEVGEQFTKKWWFLLDDSIIQTSNFWRSQRGEEPLVLAQP